MASLAEERKVHSNTKEQIKSKNQFIFFAKKWLDLHAVLLLELQILLPQGVHTVNHDLDKLNLGVSKTMLVGDVIGVS